MYRLRTIESILLVEDHVGDAGLVLAYLDMLGFSPAQLIHVRTLREAVAYLAENAVSVVLLDLHLPDGRGPGCVETICQVHRGGPIIVLTGLDTEEAAMDCLSVGAQDYLAKTGLAPENLERALGYAVARCDAQAARESARVARRHRHELEPGRGEAFRCTALRCAWPPGTRSGGRLGL